MNSINRIGLAIAGFVAALTVAGALAAEGYINSNTAAAQPTATPVAATADATPTDAPTATPTLDPQVVYVEPAATPAVITITKPARPAVVVPPPPPPAPTQAATPPTIHIIVTSPPGEDDGGPGDD